MDAELGLGPMGGERGIQPAWFTAVFLESEQCLAHSGAQEIFVE